jgi:hypothetical protein
MAATSGLAESGDDIVSNQAQKRRTRRIHGKDFPGVSKKRA